MALIRSIKALPGALMRFFGTEAFSRHSFDKAIVEFRGARFFAGRQNKIEVGLLDGRRCAYDKSHFSLIEKIVHEGDTCFDVGANIGVYSAVCALLVGDAGSVHSFEPVGHVFRRLSANIKLNGLRNIHLNDVALGSTPGTAMMYQVKEGERRGGVSSLYENENVRAMGEDKFVRTETRVETLDDYVTKRGITRVDFLKIDVEGHELHVLRGGKKTIETHKPSLLIEFAMDRVQESGDSAQAYREFFDALGYEVYEFSIVRGGVALSRFSFDVPSLSRNLFCFHPLRGSSA